MRVVSQVIISRTLPLQRYVTLDDNERTKYSARELKSVHMDVFGEFIKIVPDKCHINALNLYNQVGSACLRIHIVTITRSGWWLSTFSGKCLMISCFNRWIKQPFQRSRGRYLHDKLSLSH